MDIQTELAFAATIGNIAAVPNSPQARVYFDVPSGYGLQAGQLMKWRDERRSVDVVVCGADGYTIDRIEFYANVYKVSTSRDKGQIITLQFPTLEFKELYNTLTGVYEHGGLLVVACFPREGEYDDGEVRQNYNRKSRRRPA